MKELCGKIYNLNSDKAYRGRGGCLKQQENMSSKFSDVRTQEVEAGRSWV